MGQAVRALHELQPSARIGREGNGPGEAGTADQKYYDEFKLCPACNQVYWKGSHYERMLALIEEVSQTN
jgi:uncharacterized protein with PIN domain